MEDDAELMLGKTELELALARITNKNPGNRAREMRDAVDTIDAYIDLKIAIALEMISDRIEAKTGVRP